MTKHNTPLTDADLGYKPVEPDDDRDAEITAFKAQIARYEREIARLTEPDALIPTCAQRHGYKICDRPELVSKIRRLQGEILLLQRELAEARPC